MNKLKRAANAINKAMQLIRDMYEYDIEVSYVTCKHGYMIDISTISIVEDNGEF